MSHASTQQLVERACQAGVVIPAFNIPYLPMVEPVVRAIEDTNSFGLVMAARLEWEKFETGSLEALQEEYERFKLPGHTRLHLDHVPVIDEDDLRVDYMEIIKRAIDAGYESVMVDGSRLPLKENIACTREVAEAAHAAGIPVEAELGAVMGHEEGPLPPYEELFASGKGFTDPDEARQFVEESGADWLSVAIGNIHGAISAAAKGKKKVAARLNIEHLDHIYKTADAPLVLHGGTGIRKEYIMDSMKHGIAKINVATAIRQPYEQALEQGVPAAQEAVYQAMLTVIREDLETQDSTNILKPENQ
ncbi:MAG: class II fructose-bisphosphate aldolase [Verrucomicrobiota bacterium]